LYYKDGVTQEDNYMAILPATDGKTRTLTLDLGKSGGFWTEDDMEGKGNPTSGNHFRIPAWVGDEDIPAWNLNLNDITAFTFNTGASDGWVVTNFVKITKLEIIDGNF
jgi:hypothetical protein